jgi:hypothetical protein
MCCEHRSFVVNYRHAAMSVLPHPSVHQIAACCFHVHSRMLSQHSCHFTSHCPLHLQQLEGKNIVHMK